jgi:hypothetical protein
VTLVAIFGVCHDLLYSLENVGVSTPSHVNCNAGDCVTARHMVARNICNMMEKSLFEASFAPISVIVQLGLGLCLIISA